MAKQSRRPEMMAASVIMSSDMVYDLFCEVCSEDGKHLEAEGYCVNCQDYLCKKCFEGHRSTRISRNHVLQDKTQMPTQKPTPSLAIPPSKGTCTEKCARHPERLVEYYCRDARSLGCTVCVTMNHRLCNSVDHIPDLAEDLLDSQEYKQFTKTLNNLKRNSQRVIKRTQANEVQAEKCFNGAVNTLQELRKNVNEAFDKFEFDLETKANTIISADLKKMENISDKVQEVFDEVKNISAEIQSLQNKNQLGQLFIQMIKLEDKVDTLHTLLAEADTDSSVTTYIVEPGSQVQDILGNPTSIGNLSVQASPRPNLTHISATTAHKKIGQSHGAQSTITIPTTTPTVGNITPPVLKTSGQPIAFQSESTAHKCTSPTANSTTPVQENIPGQPHAAIPAATGTAEYIDNSNTPSVLKMTFGQPPVAQPAALTAAPIAKNPKYMRAALVSDIKVKIRSDSQACCITGSALLPGNKLILADCNNNKVKLLNLQTSKVTSELETASEPWEIANITADQVAVTLPLRSTIVFVKVTNTLKMEREMSVAGDCRAILHNNGKLIVSFADPAKIEIMALDGSVEWKLEQSGLFKLPSHMALSLDCKSIYVADREGGCVKRITPEGAVEVVYSDKLSPTGLSVDQLGRVMVCGQRSHNIHLLTPDLTRVKVLVDQLQFPQSLSYCHNTGRLFVGMESASVKVYQVS